jgi:hypothetical protein
MGAEPVGHPTSSKDEMGSMVAGLRTLCRRLESDSGLDDGGRFWLAPETIAWYKAQKVADTGTGAPLSRTFPVLCRRPR